MIGSSEADELVVQETKAVCVCVCVGFNMDQGQRVRDGWEMRNWIALGTKVALLLSVLQPEGSLSNAESRTCKGSCEIPMADPNICCLHRVERALNGGAHRRRSRGCSQSQSSPYCSLWEVFVGKLHLFLVTLRKQITCISILTVHGLLLIYFCNK